MKSFKTHGIITAKDKNFLEEVIRQFCYNVEEVTGKSCTFFTGYKDDNYWMPFTIYTEDRPKVWYVEIWFSGKCCYREKGVDLEDEWKCLKRVILNLFITGITRAFDTIPDVL